jgi:hypothetical protein
MLSLHGSSNRRQVVNTSQTTIHDECNNRNRALQPPTAANYSGFWCCLHVQRYNQRFRTSSCLVAKKTHPTATSCSTQRKKPCS